MSQNINLNELLEKKPPKQTISFGGIEIELGSSDNKGVKVGKGHEEIINGLRRASQEDIFPDVEAVCVCG